MSNKNKNLQGVVYSTNPAYTYHTQEHEIKKTLPKQQQQLRIRIEKNHRGGKTVTVIDGFIGNGDDLESLARNLKQQCGTGGTAKDGLILIQGEMRERTIKILNELGYKAK